MKHLTIALTLLALASTPIHAYQWSATEFVEQCSIVHKDKFTTEERATVDYCMGFVKGVYVGLQQAKGFPQSELIPPACLPRVGEVTVWQFHKDVLAQMRLLIRSEPIANKMNTAGTFVSAALVALYPCLVEH